MRMDRDIGRPLSMRTSKILASIEGKYLNQIVVKMGKKIQNSFHECKKMIYTDF